MTSQYLQEIPDDMVAAARYAKGALKIPAEEAITMDKVGGLIAG